MTKTVDEVAQLFGSATMAGINFAEELYPGYSGVVVAEGKARVMSWGFPLAMTGKDGRKLKPKAVTNAREDKLNTAFWRDSFSKRRCLVPVSQWAEAEGEPGRMTRTWYSLGKDEPFAVAGLWRPTAEWGDAYAMIMVDSCPSMSEVHDRMPVILRVADWDRWIGGTADQAFELCQVWSEELTVARTPDPWTKPRRTAAPALLPGIVNA